MIKVLLFIFNIIIIYIFMNNLHLYNNKKDFINNKKL